MADDGAPGTRISSGSNISSSYMLSLPDELLLEVLRSCGAGELLACRRVCKRLGALALHPYVWRHQSVDDSCGSCGPLHLGHLGVRLRRLHVRQLPVRCPLAYTTGCAVRELLVDVRAGEALHAALLIRNQETLGQLRAVFLYLEDTPADDFPVLLDALENTSGLQQIKVAPRNSSIFDTRSGGRLRDVASTALYDFHYEAWTDYDEFFCYSMLSKHAATLETVIMTSYSFELSLAPLLGRMPNLSLLNCILMPGLEAALPCPSLRWLDLRLLYEVRDLAAGAAVFLRGAPELTTVSLRYYDFTGPEDEGVDLVQALALSPLEALTVQNQPGGLPQLRTLLATLPLLPALRFLQLNETPDALLDLLRPGIVPKLRTLHLLSESTAVCTHAWLHGTAARACLAANPALHVVLQALPCPPDCDTCARDCHADLRHCPAVGFFSHAAGSCALTTGHTGKWLFFPDMTF